MNYLGIDWGEKRIGLAYADELGIAMPLKAAVESTFKERLKHIEAIIEKRRIEKIVCGYPINMDGTIGFKAKEVDVFIGQIEARFQLPVYRVDERLSSYSVEQTLKANKKRVDTKSGEIDSRAAALILQDFFDEQSIDAKKGRI